MLFDVCVTIQIKERERLLLKHLNTVEFLRCVYSINCNCKHGLTLANDTTSIRSTVQHDACGGNYRAGRASRVESAQELSPLNMTEHFLAKMVQSYQISCTSTNDLLCQLPQRFFFFLILIIFTHFSSGLINILLLSNMIPDVHDMSCVFFTNKRKIFGSI